MADKIISINIVSDSVNAVQGFNNLQSVINETDAKLKSLTTTMTTSDEGVRNYAHSVELVTSSLSKLSQLRTQTFAALGGGSVGDESTKTKQSFVDTAAKTRDIINRYEVETTRQFIQQVKERAAQNLSIYKQNTSDVLGELNRRLNLETSIRVNGAISVKTITIQAANEEYRIRKELADKLAALETKAAAGVNRGQLYASRTSAITQAEAQITAIRSNAEAQIKKQNDLLEEQKVKYKNIYAHVIEIASIYKVYNYLANSTTAALRAIPQVGIQLEATTAILTATVGSTSGAAAVMSALREEAARTGINISTLRETFRTFQASTSLAGQSLQDTWKMFTNLNTVITSLHLSADQAQGIFNAFSQIFNKSKVQSEELVKQLGNLLPGAFASFAAATHRTTQQLAQDMKKGVVYAHDTMLAYSNFLADRFSSAFDIASKGINANIGKMQTSFILLGEAVYTHVAPALNTVIKGITATADSMTGVINDSYSLNTTLTALKAVAFAGLASIIPTVTKSLLTFQTGMIGTIEGVRTFSGVAAIAERASMGLSAALGFFTNPAVVVAGIAAIAVALIDYKDKAELARESIIGLIKKQQEFDLLKSGKDKEKYLDTSLENNDKYKEYKSQVEELKKVKDEAEKALSNSKAPGDSLLILPEKLAQRNYDKALGDFKAAEEALAKEESRIRIEAANQFDTEHPLIDTSAASRKAAEIADELAGRVGALAGKKYEDANSKEIGALNQRITQIAELQNQLDLTKPENVDLAATYVDELDKAKKELATFEAGKQKAMDDAIGKQNKKGNAAIQKGLREDIGVIKEYTQTAAQEITNSLKPLDAAYKANEISAKEYFTKKEAILDEAYKKEEGYYNNQLALAKKSGNELLITQAQEGLKRLQSKKDSEKETLNTQRNAAEGEVVRIIEEINQKYDSTLNLQRSSVELSNKKLLKDREVLEANAKLGDETAKQALHQSEIISIVSTAQQNFKAANQSISEATAEHSDAIERLNVLKNTGNITDIQAAIQFKQANLEEIAAIEDKMRVMKQELDLARERIAAKGGSKQDIIDGTKELSIAYEKVNRHVEILKLQADTVKQYFETSFAPAISNSFSGFVTGSMTAKQAFISFGESIMKTLTDIAANQLSKTIINGLFSLGSAAMGGGAGSNSAGLSSWMSGSLSSSFTPNYSANGNITSGMSAASGSILNTATYFPGAKVIPLANGGVVAGEAGSEVVLPLKRGSDNKLGVVAQGLGGGGGGIVIQNMVISVQEKEGTTSQEQAKLIGESVKSQLTTLIQQQLVSSQRSGGTLNPTSMVASF